MYRRCQGGRWVEMLDDVVYNLVVVVWTRRAFLTSNGDFSEMRLRMLCSGHWCWMV